MVNDINLNYYPLKTSYLKHIRKKCAHIKSGFLTMSH